MEWFSPHLTWILGAALLLDAVYLHNWTNAIAQRPEAALSFVGFVTFLAGRDAISQRRKYISEKLDRKFYEKQYEAIKEECYGE